MCLEVVVLASISSPSVILQRVFSNVPGSGSFGLYLFSFCDFDTKIEEGEQLEAKTTT